MKTIIQTLVSCLLALAIMVGLAVIICAGESAMDASVWNDGICRCGGEFEFSNATHRKNGGNFYYYICNDCGKVIETNHQQTKSHCAAQRKNHGIIDIVAGIGDMGKLAPLHHRQQKQPKGGVDEQQRPIAPHIGADECLIKE